MKKPENAPEIVLELSDFFSKEKLARAGMLNRTLAWASGILSVVAGIGWMAIMTTITGPGALIFTIGGAAIFAAPITTK